MAKSGRDTILKAHELRDSGHLDDARTLYQSILRKRPTDTEALIGMASIGRLNGDRQTAKKMLERAYAKHSENAQVLIELALQQIEVGKFKNAEKALLHAVSKNSHEAGPYLELGRLYHHLNDPQRAIGVLQIGCKRLPRNVALLESSANALQMVGDWVDAIVPYEQAISQCPTSYSLHYNLATTYQAVGRFAEAAQLYAKAIELETESVEAKSGLLNLLESTGDFGEPNRAVEQVLSHPVADPAYAKVVARVCKRLGTPQAAVGYIERVFEQNEHIQRSHELILRFLLGDLYERLDRVDEAFAQYEHANRLSPSTFDGNAYRIFVDSIMSVFHAGRAAELSVETVHSDRPIFIVGMPRSGTSLVEQVLSSHPTVFGGGELNILPNQIQQHTLGTAARTNVPFPECFRQSEPERSLALAQSYVASLDEHVAMSGGDATDYSRITDKLPHNFHHLGLISLILPNARIINCRREPSDTCFSCFATSLSPTHSYSNDLAHVATAYREYERLMEHWRTVIPEDRLLDVQYEDLVQNAETVSQQMIEFVGLDWDDRCLKHHESNRITLTASADQVRQPMYTSSVGRAERFQKHLKPLFDALGE